MTPAQRVLRAFMRFSLLTSVVVFFVLGVSTFCDQWIAGHASLQFMLGTAFIAAGFCIGLFAIIAAVGLAISIAFSDEPPLSTPRRPPVRPRTIARRVWNGARSHQ
jgi:hypothetical protein